MIGLYVVWVMLLMGMGFAAAVSDPEAASEPNFALMGMIYGSMLVMVPLFLLVYAPYQAALIRSIAAGVGLDEARFRMDVKALSVWWLTLSNLVLVIVSLGFLAPFVQARTVKYMVARLTSDGEAQLALARQASSGPKSGEGLADAFGFAPI